jgi:methionine biosynthesis protein MetW
MYDDTETAGILRPDLLAIAELIQPGEKVLDLGCGDGTLLVHLERTRQATVRGIELSESGVLACVRNGLSVRQGNLHEGLGDYPDQSFDTVILSQTLPYLNDPAFIVREMLRVGKRAIVGFANWGHWHCRLGLLMTGRMPVAADLPQPWSAAPRVRPLTVRDFEQWCKQNHFHVAAEVYLHGQRRFGWRRVRNLWATTAIFNLNQVDGSGTMKKEVSRSG